MENNLSVILLTCGSYEQTHARLAELFTYMPYESELVWVDNATSEEDALNGITWWRNTLPKKVKLKFYRFDKNVGYGLGNNKGAELATSENLMFISSDVIIKKSFYEMISAALAGSPKALFGDRVIWWDGGWNHIEMSDGNSVVAPYAEGYLLAIRKHWWDKLGGFDPIFSPADCEDLDLSISASELGMDILQLPQGYFQHIGGVTASKVLPDRLSITKANKIKLDAKWKDKIRRLYAKD